LLLLVISKTLKDQGRPWKNHQLFGVSIFLRTMVMNPSSHPCNPRGLFLFLMTVKHWLYPAPLPWAYMLPNVKLRLECRNWALRETLRFCFRICCLHAKICQPWSQCMYFMLHCTTLWEHSSSYIRVILIKIVPILTLLFFQCFHLSSFFFSLLFIKYRIFLLHNQI
jgi:hypothetical protein